MLKDINLSQLLAMISVSGSVKQIKVQDGDLTWMSSNNIDLSTSHNISIKWNRSKFSGSENQYLCMILDDLRKPYAWLRDTPDQDKYLEPVLHAYYYQGDNCNKRTQFIYEVIANEINIIDDIGLVGNAGTYDRKNLLKIDPNEIYYQKVNNYERWEHEQAYKKRER